MLHFAVEYQSLYDCKSTLIIRSSLLFVGLKFASLQVCRWIQSCCKHYSYKHCHGLWTTSYLYWTKGISSTARALIDTGAGASLLTGPRAVHQVEVCGISEQSIKQSAPTSIVHFKASPMELPRKTLEITALVLHKIAQDLPTEYIYSQQEMGSLGRAPPCQPSLWHAWAY